MKKVWSFVLTGGPCSGKTTGLSILEQELTERGYYVLIVPETATELISTGIRPFGDSLDVFTFQNVLFEKQLHKEKLYKWVADKLPAEKVVILYDRGLMDNKSYITSTQFQQLLKNFSTNEVEIRARYNGVFHLVTAANGAEEFYTLENNASRTETPEKARELDALGIANWTGHPYLHIIDNRTNFEQKMQRLLNELYAALGEPIPLQIERKYLIQKPSISSLSQYASINVTTILQTYMDAPMHVERRLRKYNQDGNCSYYLTNKREISGSKRLKTEEKISERMYTQYLSETTSSCSIQKERICFVYHNQYFKLDLFDFSNDFALLEIELTTENDAIDLPDFLKVVKEVTSDPHYRNYHLAKTQTLL